MSTERPYASRAGEKLAAALDAFQIDPTGRVCADFGSNVGGFTDCLLRRGAAKVYAVDTGYGVLAYTLRKDSRVAVMERTNAMHVELPEVVDLVTIDVAWTRQLHILPAAARALKPSGTVITLIKPHYEAPRERLRGGVLSPEDARDVLNDTLDAIRAAGWESRGVIESPIVGQKGNTEFLAWLGSAGSGGGAGLPA